MDRSEGLRPKIGGRNGDADGGVRREEGDFGRNLGRQPRLPREEAGMGGGGGGRECGGK